MGKNGARPPKLSRFARRNYIASNLQNSQVEVCFCALRNTPVDLAKVYYLDSFAIQLHIFNHISMVIPLGGTMGLHRSRSLGQH